MNLITRLNLEPGLKKEWSLHGVHADNRSVHFTTYRGADKSLGRPSSRCILFDGENISFDASIVLYIYK